MKPLRVLLVAPECPWPPDIGLKTHLFHMISELAAHTELSVYGFYFTDEERARWQQWAAHQGFTLAGQASVHQGVRLRWEQLRCLLRGRPLAEGRYAVRGARREVAASVEQAAAAGRPFDWVAYEVFHTLMGEPDGPPGSARRLLFPVDCYSLYYARMHAQASTLAEWLRTRYLAWTCARMERRLYSSLHLLATVAEADAAALRRQVPGVRVEVVPVPTADRRERLPLGPTGRRPRVLIGGYFAMPTIAHDTRLFLRAWLRQPSRPPADLVVWGRGARAAGLEADCRAAGVQLVEWVEDYDAFLASGDIYVYPQRFACGVQTKIQQAMRAGLAVLASAIVLEPLRVRDRQEGWAVAEPAAAARLLAELLLRPEEIDRLGAAAAARMRDCFAPARVGHQLLGLLGRPARQPERETEHDHLLSC